jgi:DNA end-binding protein Ku
MPQAVWTGSLSFGLVNVPVKLYGATSPKDVRFHQFEGRSGRRVRHRRVVEEPAWEPQPEEPGRGEGPPPTVRPGTAPETEPSSRPGAGELPGPPQPAGTDVGPPAWEPAEEVPFEDVVKGYEVEPGSFVLVDPDELRALAPERTRVIEIEDFVHLGDIDPVFFERSYYVAPASREGAAKPYWLLFRAMEQAGRVGMARFVMRTKEYLAAVRPGRDVLMLETMFFADEVRDPGELWLPPPGDLQPREVQMATRLIDALTVDWSPERYRDTYRDRVLEMIRGRAEERGVVRPPDEEPETAPVHDIMAALKASLEEARRARGGKRGGRPGRATGGR